MEGIVPEALLFFAVIVVVALATLGSFYLLCRRAVSE
jgi:hypothetical protein